MAQATTFLPRAAAFLPKTAALLIGASAFSLVAFANTGSGKTLQVEMHSVDKNGVQASIGHVMVAETSDGLVFTPMLKGLEPGLHGFHIHQNPDCGTSTKDGEVTPAGAAGGHFDPEDKKAHKAPWEEGHMGDLPALYVADDNSSSHPVFKEGLELSDLHGRALMIHQGGDNYSDQPKPLGGGGPRVACGVIEK